MTEKEIIQALRCGEDANGTPRPEPSDGEIVCYDPLKLAAADLIERLTAENAVLREKVPRWISVDDRHPKPGTRVLATDGVFVGEAYRTSADTWRRYDGIAMRDCIGSVVTHWMPLPEAPKFADVLRGAPEAPEEGEKA
jgi:hypothetical protein|nr:MAG TPA: Protein of unknown function (DUF551) [Caudoviricetes sp.]